MSVMVYASRSTALTAAGIGAMAGCMGTWFEMSHGVFCIPTLTLPPLALSQQIAVGSTVVGVAGRQVLSAAVYSLDPSTPDVTGDTLDELVDVRLVLGLSAASTAAAFIGTAVMRRASPAVIRKSNGVFMMGAAFFVQWRNDRYRAINPEDAKWVPSDEKTVAPVPRVSVPQADAADAAGYQYRRQMQQISTAGRSVPQAEADDRYRALNQADAFISTAVNRSEAARFDMTPAPASSPVELLRIVSLGVASGLILGFLGVGPAWMLAPMLTWTDEKLAENKKDSAKDDADKSDGPKFGSSGADERSRRTACLAMVPASLVAAFRHFTFGHVESPLKLAVPIGIGAVAGSAAGGYLLEEIPIEDESRSILAILMFGHGCWCLSRGMFAS